MNKAYRNVWNEATGTFVAVAENVKARGKRSSSAKKLAGAALAVAALGSAGVAHATVTIGDSTAPGVWDGTEIVFDGAGSSISFTNGGTIDFGATGGTVTNLSNAALNAGSKDAVTGQQLYSTNQDVGTLQTSVGTLNTNVGTLQTNVGTLNTNVGTLQTNVGTLNTNVGTLQTNVSSAQTDITSLQDSLALLQGGNATAGYTGAKYFRVNSDLDDAAATGDDSVAIGPDAVAAGNSALAAGVAASAAGANAVATGAGASASGARAVASGYQANAEGVAAIAIGDASQAVGDGTIALGDAASVDSEFVQNAIAIGTDAKVTGNGSSSAVALGAAAHASAAAATALGAGAQASAANAIALGNSTASSGNALAAGNGAVANSPNAISLGTDAGVGTNGTLAADRTSHIAIGTRAGQNVVGNQTVAMGFEAGSNIEGDQNIALGTQAGSGIDGDFNVALGYQANRNTGAVDHAVALGALTTAGRDAVAAGYGAEASSEGSIAIGTNSHVSSGQGVALGRNATASGSSVALGTNSVAVVDDANGVGFLTGSDFTGGSVVSVGYRDSGSGQSQQRRVVNVADGSQAYDAVNVRQLQATQTSVANLVGVTVDGTTGQFSKITVGKDVNGQDIVVDTVAEGLELLGSGAVVSVLPADAVKYNGAGQINNLTAGTLGTDAVNVAQLNAAVADNSSKYFSVNSANPVNRDNTGATGSNAIAIGPEAGATADSAVALGYRARAEAKESVAVGYNANALGENSSVLGNTSFAYDKGGIAIGQTARSTGLNSIVVGTNAQADKKTPNDTVNNAIVVGTDAEVSADDGIAIGHSSLANQLRGIAQGYDATSTGVDATAIGSNSVASATNAYASGTRASASGTSAIASGTDARGYASNAIAMGNNAVSGRVIVDPTDAPQNFDTIAIGSSSLADSRNASALGRGARATAEEALAIGDAASVSGSYSTGVGNENTVTGSQSLAAGYQNTVSGSSANAVGHTNQVAGSANSVLGNTNIVASTASRSTAVGNANSVAAANAGAFGNDNTLTNRANNSRIVGNDNQVTAANSFVVGNGNELNVSDAFVIGNGSNVTVQSGVALGSGSASTTGARDGYVPNAGKTNQQSAVAATRSTTGAIAVGSSTVRRQITGLAAGTADTDAVNVAQLKATGWNVQTDGDTSTHVSTGEGHTVDIGIASAENNLTVTRTTTGDTTTIDYALKKNLDLGAAGSVKTGNTTLNNAGVQIANGGSTTNLGAGSLSVSNGTNTVSVNSGSGTVNGLTNRTFTPGSIVNGQAATEDQLGQVRSDLIADGFALEDENGNKVQKNLGQAVAVVGDGNIETVVQNGELVVGLADDVNVSNNLTVGGNSSVAGNSTVGGTLNVAGATTLNNTLNVTGATTLAGGATIGNNLTVNGGTNVNFGGNQLHGVAEGTLGTDAVNVNQLNNTRTDIINEGFALKAADGQTVKKNLGEAIDVVGGDSNVTTLVEGGQVKVKLADNVSVNNNLAVGGNSNVAGNSTVGGTLNVAGATTLAGGATINGATINNSLNVSNGATVNMGGNKVGGVGAGEVSSTSQEAVNGSQLYDVANRPLGFSADQGSNVSRKLGETLAINGADSNIVTKTTPANGIEIELAKNLDLGAAGSVKTGNTTLNNAGVQIANAGNLTTLGAGQLSVSNGTNTVVVNSNSGTVNGLTNKTFNPNAFTSGQAATEDQLKLVSDVANTGWNLSTEGASASNVAPGETVDLASSDGNIVITKGLNDENVKFALANDLNVTNVNAAGNLTVAGATNLAGGATISNNLTVTPNTTVNMGGNKITNVAAGTDDSDAVNLGQLKDVSQEVTDLANTPLTFTAESGTPLDRKLGQEVAFTGSNSNLSTSTTANGVEIALADNLDLGANGSVKTGDTLVNNAGVKVGQNVTLSNDGLRIANGPSITAGGIDAGDKFITNVKAGVNDQDAVNVSQLKGVEAIANTGWNVTANGQNSTNVKPGDTVDLTDVDGNIVVVKGTDTNPHQVTFGLSDSISIKDNLTVGGNSSVAGNSTVGGTLNVAGATTLAGGATISNNLTVTPNTTVNMGGNKITNVAKGTDGQDAVNVSQLNELADTALNFTDDAGVVVSRKLGETLALEGADDNIITKATADGIAIELAKNLDLGSTGSVKLGDTTVSNTGLVIANGPSVTNAGINAGGSKITNVADGEISATSKDAINGSQLKQVSDVANTGWNLSTEGASASNVAPGETVDLASSDGNIVITKGLNDENVKFALANDLNVTNVNVAGNTSIAGNLTVAGTTNLGDSTLVVNKGNVTVAPNTTVNMGGNKITNVAAGTDDSDAVNLGQLKDVSQEVTDLANTPLTFTAESGTPLDRKLGQEVAFTGSNSNLSTSTTANGVEIALADNLDLGANGSVKTGDTLVNNAGVKVGQNVTLSNDGLRIANGPSITAGGIDAGDKFITNVKAGVNDQDAVNVSQLKGVEAIANTGWNVTANGQNSTNVKPGDTVDLTDVDGNIVVAKGTDTNPHQVTFGLSDNLNLNTVNVSNNLTVAGTTNLGNSTLVVKEGDIKVAGGTTVNMGGNKITNVAKGTDGTDAVNKDQLDELANTGLTFAANAGTVSKKLGETVGIKGTLASNAAASSSNIRTEVNGAGEVEILLANNLDLGDLGSVKTGDTIVNNAGVKVGNDVTLGNTGLIIANGPSVTRGGINAGGLKITNVADGEISATSKDAINGSQLKAVSDVANTGWNVSVNGNAGGERSQVKPGDTVDFANDDGNVVITKRPDENDIKVNLAKDLTLDSVTTGQTVMNNDGVKVGNDVFLSSTGLTAGNVIISSVTGINAGGFKITNVAAGTDDTDAVNVSQLKQVQQNVDNLGDRAVKYDGNVGDPKNQITLEGDVSTDGGKTGGTKITNVARGDISENSTDAINGSQIKEMGDSIADGMGGGSKFENGKLVTELNVGGNTYNNVNDALNGVNNDLNTRIDDVEANAGWQIDTNGEGSSKVATGKTVNFVNGSNIEITRETTANGDNNVTVGLAQDITVNSVTAKEVKADKVQTKEVVIENGPTINQDGIDMAGKTITNVAEGRAPTDAVNVSQLQTATEGLQNQVNSVRGDLHKLDNKLSAGVAAAMATAGLPQAYMPGKSMAAMAGGTWNGETGFAIGVSTISDNGSWVMKFSGNTNSRGDYGGAVGVGYQW